VVVNEGLSSFHVEALKAQAVAARGYALANLGRFSGRGFDVDDSTLSQVYRGQSSETETALAAAQGTEGLVALHGGRILSALYSSSMGGRTEDNEWIFPSGGIPGSNADPALRGIHDAADPPRHDLSTEPGVLAFYGAVWPDAYEVHPATGQPLTAQHRWTRTRTAAELLARLKDPSRPWGVPASASRIDELRVLLRGSSGRAMQLLVRGDWGEATISGWSDLRALASLAGVTPGGTAESSAPNSPSTFTLVRDGSGAVARVTFYGGGFGHNVGMSQYGAQGRALRGQDFSQILASYYSGSQLGSAPMLLRSGTSFTTRLRTGRVATLVVENQDLRALGIEIEGRSFVMPLRLGEERLVDLIDYVAAGATRVRLRPIGDGAAVAYIRAEPDARERPR
jgi:peptidoglycan hydrolase-like amidase